MLIRPALRTYIDCHLDSTRWQGIAPRPDDIILSTSPKSGTTWTQRILAMLILGSTDLPDSLFRLSPWIDARFMASRQDVLAQAEAQTHRRFLKSHLPLDGLPYWRDVKYIYVGRDGRDAFMSLWNHYRNYKPVIYALLSGGENYSGPPMPPCPADVRDFWRMWTERGSFPWELDGYPFSSHLSHFRSFWEMRHAPNVLLLHYNDLKRDLRTEMERIAAFIGVDVAGEAWPRFLDAASFEAMSRDAETLVPEINLGFEGGTKSFIYKGTNGRWREVLSPEDLAAYDEAVRRVLTPVEARWLAEGRAAGEPRAL